jgi:predicted translin family RNA/ssDNA-binding protein
LKKTDKRTKGKESIVMADKTCPKCNKRSEDGLSCQHCDINFDEYETSKQEKLIEVRVLLSENKYDAARELAENLPGQFPDNRTDFLLLLSNIKRDISIVDKYEQANNAYDEGDFSRTSMLLRNIKAFDPNLNEKVISLRRKVERNLQNSEKFNRAVQAFDGGDYAEAKSLFKQIHGFGRQDEVDGYIEKISYVTGAMREEAVECIRKKQFDVAREKFAALQSAFPDMQEEIEGYATLLGKRVEIKNNIFNAAKQAQKEKRFLEAKILYSYLESRFPEFLPQVLPHIQEIGHQAVISLADLEDLAMIDLSALGLDDDREGRGKLYSAADSKDYVA